MPGLLTPSQTALTKVRTPPLEFTTVPPPSNLLLYRWFLTPPSPSSWVRLAGSLAYPRSRVAEFTPTCRSPSSLAPHGARGRDARRARVRKSRPSPTTQIAWRMACACAPSATPAMLLSQRSPVELELRRNARTGNEPVQVTSQSMPPMSVSSTASTRSPYPAKTFSSLRLRLRWARSSGGRFAV